MHFKVCVHTRPRTHTLLPILNIKWPMPTTLTSIICLARTVGRADFWAIGLDGRYWQPDVAA